MKKLLAILALVFCLNGRAQLTAVLYFSDSTNGSFPEGSLYYDNTFLYAMTYSGGINELGTIVKVKPDGTGYSKLLDFNGTSNGGEPYGYSNF